MNKNTFRSAFDTAIQLLSRREQSVFELTTKLSQKGHAKTDIANAITRLIELDLQSDQRYACMIVRSKTSQGYGERVIRQQLKQHNITDNAITSAFTDTDGQADTTPLQDRIDLLIQKRGADLSEEKEKAKLVRFLARRGFDFDDIYEGIKRNQTE